MSICLHSKSVLTAPALTRFKVQPASESCRVQSDTHSPAEKITGVSLNGATLLSSMAGTPLDTLTRAHLFRDQVREAARLSLTQEKL